MAFECLPLEKFTGWGAFSVPGSSSSCKFVKITDENTPQVENLMCVYGKSIENYPQVENL